VYPVLHCNLTIYSRAEGIGYRKVRGIDVGKRCDAPGSVVPASQRGRVRIGRRDLSRWLPLTSLATARRQVPGEALQRAFLPLQISLQSCRVSPCGTSCTGDEIPGICFLAGASFRFVEARQRVEESESALCSEGKSQRTGASVLYLESFQTSFLRVGLGGVSLHRIRVQV
jgi:hypothetical protein